MSEWTIATLKEHFDEKFKEAKEAVANALASQDKAILKAENAQKAYNDSHNDLTRKMDDQYKQMLPRQEADSREKNIEEKLNQLRGDIGILNSRMDTQTGKGVGITQLLGYIIAAITLIISAINYYKN